MSIELIDKIKPKNNGDFPLVDAHDVAMPDGTRLDTWEGSGDIPTFDLVKMGLPEIDVEGEAVTLEADTAEIRADLEKGAVRFRVKVQYRGLVLECPITMHDLAGGLCSYAFDAFGGMPMMVTLIFKEGSISAAGVLLATVNGEGGDTPATSIDLSGLDTTGQIVETYADGSTKTTTIESDADGNPIKITDGDGNVTELIW